MKRNTGGRKPKREETDGGDGRRDGETRCELEEQRWFDRGEVTVSERFVFTQVCQSMYELYSQTVDISLSPVFTDT